MAPKVNCAIAPLDVAPKEKHTFSISNAIVLFVVVFTVMPKRLSFFVVAILLNDDNDHKRFMRIFPQYGNSAPGQFRMQSSCFALISSCSFLTNGTKRFW